MLESRREVDLALKALRRQACSELLAQHLDHDATTEFVVFRHKHVRHPAVRQLAFERVCASELLLKLVAQMGGHKYSRDETVLAKIPQSFAPARSCRSVTLTSGGRRLSAFVTLGLPKRCRNHRNGAGRSAR